MSPSYQDSYEIRLHDAELSASDLTRLLARSAPTWVNMAMALRDRVVTRAGIQPVGSIGASEELRTGDLVVGQKFDAFTVWHVDESEVVVGEDDRHLDFRLSIMKVCESGADKLVLSMVVVTHNLLGRIYLGVVLPFHLLIMRQFLSRAHDSSFVRLSNTEV